MNTSIKVSTTLLLAMMVNLISAGGVAAQATGFAEARAQRRAFTDQFMKAVLADPLPPGEKKSDSNASVYAMAALYTGEQIERGNERLRNALKLYAGDDGKLTPAEATKIKWKMRGWLRVYYLFYDKSKFFPGRLDTETQAMMEEAFFQYGCGKSTVKRAALENIWHIQGSENHDMMDLSNAYLALQAVQQLPAYKDRKLPDGHTPAEHVAVWEKYYARYALERARNGLFVEVSPIYGKWFLGEIINMYEFAESPAVSKRMELLLHLIWADWSVDQLNGVRGGGKTRSYQGHYSQSGGRDSWDRMGRHLMGMEPWVWNSHGGLSTMAIATSKYEPPDVVMSMALEKQEFEPFVYQSNRPAKVLSSPRGVYRMDPKPGGMLRYSYCTPDYIMGSWSLDTRTDYAAINTQNRWQGVIFPTGQDARVFPQSVGLGNRKTYNQHVAVQHRNVMLVATHPKARQTGQMRVYFHQSIHEGVIEKNGWVIARVGDAWLGVKFLDGKTDPPAKAYEFKQADPTKRNEGSRNDNDGARWLWPKADKPPVVMVGSRTDSHATADDFAAYLASHEYTVANGQVTYKYADDRGEQTQLELGGKLLIPRINGRPVSLYPDKVFDSPYVQSKRGSGVVTLRKGEKQLVLDFNEPDPSQATARPITIGLIGDSTVAQQSGWGPAFAKRFGDGVQVLNYARNGATMQSLNDRFDELVKLKPDYVLIQFGHNDQKRYGTAEYGKWLRSYIDRVKASGGEPIVLSSLVRRTFDDNGRIVSSLAKTDKFTFQDTLDAYAKAAKLTAAETEVGFIDLYELSRTHHDKLGPEASMAYNFKPGDKTHLNPKGAAAIAGLIVAELEKAAPALADHTIETGGRVTKTITNKEERDRFDQANTIEWKAAMTDDCTGDWTEQWFLDGEVGKVTTGPEGMTLTAGPEFRNDAHHMVLWTKQSFTGDVKIEYDYTRRDNENRCVNIIYIQATGSGREGIDTDITKWADQRRVPAMRAYFNNMNTYHISYAAFGNDGEAVKSYIRGRRYMPHRTGLKGTELEPEYWSQTLFEQGVKHHITVIKKDRELLLRIENPGEVLYGRLLNKDLPAITEGRIGLRHMFTRSATYENFRVSTPGQKKD